MCKVILYIINIIINFIIQYRRSGCYIVNFCQNNWNCYIIIRFASRLRPPTPTTPSLVICAFKCSTKSDGSCEVAGTYANFTIWSKANRIISPINSGILRGAPALRRRCRRPSGRINFQLLASGVKRAGPRRPSQPRPQEEPSARTQCKCHLKTIVQGRRGPGRRLPNRRNDRPADCINELFQRRTEDMFMPAPGCTRCGPYRLFIIASTSGKRDPDDESRR